MVDSALIGLIAAACTTSAFVPQVVKVWRSRSTKDISLAMSVVLTAGTLLWLIYGLIQADVPLIAANGITTVLVGIILFFKLRHG
jgi:MtN3 and saliva related transmembrane protein